MARLYAVGRIQGHKRGKRNSTPHTTLIKIDGVESQEDARFYLGKVSIHHRHEAGAGMERGS